MNLNKEKRPARKLFKKKPHKNKIKAKPPFPKIGYKKKGLPRSSFKKPIIGKPRFFISFTNADRSAKKSTMSGTLLCKLFEKDWVAGIKVIDNFSNPKANALKVLEKIK
jgi:hypothetical protein